MPSRWRFVASRMVAVVLEPFAQDKRLVFCWKECFNVGMLKTEAIEILGGTVTSAARAVGVSPQAVSLWPDVLTDAIRDRVQAAMWRQSRQLHSANRSPSAIESAANQPA